MITRRLAGEEGAGAGVALADALAQANAALLAATELEEEEWILPAGTHDLVGPLVLGGDGRRFTLRGPGAASCTLRMTEGPLRLTGAEVALRAAAVAGTGVDSALELTGGTLVLSSARVACQGGETCIALTCAAGDGTVDLEDVTVDGVSAGVSGGVVTGVLVGAGRARATGLIVRGLAGGDVTAVDAVCREIELADLSISEAQGTGKVVGLEVAAIERIDVAGAQVATLTGVGAVGVRLLCAGGGSTSALASGSTGVSAVDLDVGNVDGGAGEAAGIVVGSSVAVRLRGFDVARVHGARATGLLALAGRGLEVTIGTVAEITGGTAAAGVRVLATPSVERVVVGDVAVERVAAAPIPTDFRPVRDADGNTVWQAWAAQAVQSLADAVLGPLTLPVPPDTDDVAGVHIDAVVDEFAPLLDEADPGAIHVQDGSIRTITGTAVQIDGGLRPVVVRRIEAWTSVFAAWIEADEVLLAQLTWHRHYRGLHFGPGEVLAYDSIFSAIGGSPFSLDEDTELSGDALFAPGGQAPFRELGPTPYLVPGADDLPAELLAGMLPAVETVDLRLQDGTSIAALAVAVPGDGDEDQVDDDEDLAADESPAGAFVGAYPPSQEHRCELRDPQPRPLRPPRERPAPPTLVDYRARDAKSLLAVMLERARTVMAPWTDRGPADFTTMLFETLADRLDHLAYQQERAVSEGFLADARLRRSVEDHARALDYQPDPGLSASAMIRFRLDPAAVDELVAERLAALNLTALPAGTSKFELVTEGGALELPADTLVANTTPVEHSVVFATDEPFTWFAELDEMRLASDVEPGDTGARLVGHLDSLAVGRWLVLRRGRGATGHVVRVTTVERSVEVTVIGWDPRRPAPIRFLADDDVDTGGKAAIVLGNVVPAQHGLPLAQADDGAVSSEHQASGAAVPSLQPFEATLLPWQRLLVPTIDGSVERELALPFDPVSVRALGYPFPGELRRGTPELHVAVEDDVWRRVEDLARHGPDEEVYVLRASPHGGAAVRFGDGVNGAALPARPATVQLELRVGRGKVGNVGEAVLARLLHVPRNDGQPGLLTDLLARPDGMETVRRLIRVDNPLPAVGGREPESLEHIRYHAPFGVSQALSAVTPADYVRLVRALPEVAGACARVTNLGIRSVVRVTVLLRDEDTINEDERLRRWALVRGKLEEVRLLGFDVETVPPRWVPLDVDVIVDADAHARADQVHDDVVHAVAGDGGLLDPDVDGLGTDVQLASLYNAVSAVRGVTAVRIKRFRRLAPHAPDRLREGVIAIARDEVAVVQGPQRPNADGLLTVTVCGGLR